MVLVVGSLSALWGSTYRKRLRAAKERTPRVVPLQKTVEISKKQAWASDGAHCTVKWFGFEAFCGCLVVDDM